MKKLLLTSSLLLSISLVPTIGNVFAYSDSENYAPATITASEDTASPYLSSPYLLTTVEVTTRADTEYVYAVARNTFTLFISTVPVTIYLYSSPTYTFNIAEMTLEAQAHTSDLDINKEISCKAMHTEQKYWVAHCVFKTDGKTKTATSNPVLYSIDGNVLE